MTAAPLLFEVDPCFLGRLAVLAREHGRPIDPRLLGTRHGLRGEPVSLATVTAVGRDAGFGVSPCRLSWDALGSVALPALMVFRDRSTAILDAVVGDPPHAVLIREDGPDAPPLSLDRDDLAPLWGGEILLLEILGAIG